MAYLYYFLQLHAKLQFSQSRKFETNIYSAKSFFFKWTTFYFKNVIITFFIFLHFHMLFSESHECLTVICQHWSVGKFPSWRTIFVFWNLFCASPAMPLVRNFQTFLLRNLTCRNLNKFTWYVSLYRMELNKLFCDMQ